VAEAVKVEARPEADSKPDSGRGRLEDPGQEGATEDAAAFAYEDEGVEIVRVRTGAEALTAGQVDLILLDLHLGHAYNPLDILNENRRPSTYAKPGRETVPSSRSPSTTVADISPAHRRRR
jgi:hypothetical protein